MCNIHYLTSFSVFTLLYNKLLPDSAEKKRGGGGGEASQTLPETAHPQYQLGRS